MKVLSLEASCFRNLSHAKLEPCEGINILYGDNAQGKTNLIEAIWLFTGAKSFRGTKDADLVQHGQPRARLSLDFQTQQRAQQAQITIEGRRTATLNGLPLPAVNRLAGRFCGVIFSPDHLSLIKDGPEMRRRFIDAACCQLRPTCLPILVEYNRVLTQRNALLKTIKSGSELVDPLLLDAFDERLSQTGARVRMLRWDYVTSLSVHTRYLYRGLSAGREEIEVTYQMGKASFSEQELAERLKKEIRKGRQADIRAGFSTVGPHRDTIEITIGGQSARVYASQGQQRSAVLAMKLAEATLLFDGYGERPIILLDDVMSELDRSRQQYLLEHLHGWQVFITCCEPSALERLTGGKTFSVCGGKLTPAE